MRCSGPTEQLLEISLGFSIVCLGFLVISVRSWWTAAVSRRQPIAEDLETSEETDALIPPGTSDVRWQHGKRAAATLLGVFSLFMFSLGLYDATVVDTNTSLNGELPPPQKYCTSNVLVVSFHVIQAVTWLLVAGVCSAPKAFRIVPGSFFSVRKILCLEFIDQSVMLVMVSLGLFVYDSSDTAPKSISDVVNIIGLSFQAVLVLIAIIVTWNETNLEVVQVPSSSWTTAWNKIKKLFPFLWPQGWYLQSLVLACYLLLALGRVVNVMVPLAYKRIVDDLTLSSSNGTFSSFLVDISSFSASDKHLPLAALSLYTFFRFLQGGVGLLSSLQYFLWIPVGQYTTRKVSVKMLEHLHSLSFQFHINRKTGELLRVVDRGTSSIGSLLSYLAFNILPVFVDIGIAVVFFAYVFDLLMAGIVLSTMILYIGFTIWITEWRTRFRREMNDRDAASRGRAVDSLLNFEAVKYFTNEDWEVKEYERSILDYQKADWKSSASLNLLNTAQNLVITLGLFAGLYVCASRVLSGASSVGDFVAFVTYLLQLYQPLNWFGTYYRVIQQNFIDMEKMLELFESGESIKDDPEAEPLRIIQGGGIVFDNVSFAYMNNKPALQNVTFTVPPGKKVALVGESGGGKSTIQRLLLRFYDVQSGQIRIDGQDIRRITRKSLREQIGVVPQDTVLFNDTVEFNIRYGDLKATQHDIEAVAKAAQIHERIMAFPAAYNTKVGERGLRLSGGEKQRIAIARALLKNPAIVLFDEATSALDNVTEVRIQEAFQTLCAHRTTLVIAHRLSSIVDADEIIVLKDGQIVERGTHDQLLQRGDALACHHREHEAVYYQLWMRQATDEDSAQQDD